MKDGVGLSHTDAPADPRQIHLALIRTLQACSLLTQGNVGCAVVSSVKQLGASLEVAFPKATSQRGGKMGQIGQRFRLKSPSMGTVLQQDGKKIVFQIPAGSEIVAIDPIPEQLSKNQLCKVNIQWRGRTMTMYLVDVQERGERIQTAEAK